MKFYVVLIKKIVLLSFLMLSILPMDAISQSKGLESLKKTLKSGKVFKASLQHIFIDTFTGDTLQNAGLVWIYEKGYRIEMDDRIISVFDKTSIVYNTIKDQVIYSNYSVEDDDFAPSRFLSATEKEYQVSEKKIETGWAIELVSKDDFSMFTQILIDLDRASKPLRISAFDQNSNSNTSLFTKAEFVEFNKSLTDIQFSKKTEVIDLRK